MGTFGEDKLNSAINQLKRFKDGMRPRDPMTEKEEAALIKVLLVISEIRVRNYTARQDWHARPMGRN